MGKFTGSHPNGDPIIECYDDAYSFIVSDPNNVELADAITLRIFEIDLAYKIAMRASIDGHGDLNCDQIDEYIRNYYAARDLRDCRSQANKYLYNYTQSTTHAVERGWQGFIISIARHAIEIVFALALIKVLAIFIGWLGPDIQDAVNHELGPLFEFFNPQASELEH